MKLETLYKTMKTSATQVCNISTLDDTYTVEWGQLNGAMQTKTTTCLPKNVGRSNATTGAEQAILEAKAKHTKKVKAGYSLDISAPITVQLPQKVKVYQDQLKNVDFESDRVFTSPKYNGVNGIYRFVDSELTLWSRGGERYPDIPHLTPGITLLMKKYFLTELNLELYIHGEHLQDIQSAVKKPKELSTKLVAMIFDLPTYWETYIYRALYLETLRKECDSFIQIVEVTEVFSHEEIEVEYEKAMSQMYEGLMIRNGKGLYVHNQRSSDVFKYKKTMDREFLVHGWNLDKNSHPVFECFAGHPEEGKSFSVKLKGTAESRLAMADIADSYIGKYLKVEFETYSKASIPLKPVGIMFRECDSAGEPLE